MTEHSVAGYDKLEALRWRGGYDIVPQLIDEFVQLINLLDSGYYNKCRLTSSIHHQLQQVKAKLKETNSLTSDWLDWRLEDIYDETEVKDERKARKERR